MTFHLESTNCVLFTAYLVAHTVRYLTYQDLILINGFTLPSIHRHFEDRERQY